MKKLAEFQSKLKAPKGQFNNFGKYKYRSAEDIIEAVKLVINPEGYYLNISDEMIMLGNRFYIRATATLSDGSESISCSAYAREEETKKGMDGAQITGAASSYARKYALNGLFAIDDTKDPDSTNNHDGNKGSEPVRKVVLTPDHANWSKAVEYLKGHVQELGQCAGTSRKTVAMDIEDRVVNTGSGIPLFLGRTIVATLSGSPDMVLRAVNE